MIRILFFFMILFLALPVQAKNYDASLFARLPILDEGRVKPIEAFARAKKKELAGNERNATQWLITILFDPARGEQMPTIKITNPDLLSLLDIEKDAGKLYSYRTVFSALDRQQKLVLSIIEAKEESWTPAQRELIRLQQKTVMLQRLLGSLSALLPLDFDPPRSYLEMADSVDSIQKWVKTIVQRKGEDYESFAPEEKRLAELSFLLTSLKENGKRSDLFRVIHDDESWRTPWDVVLAADDVLDGWAGLAKAFHAADIRAWNDSLRTVYESSSVPRPLALKAEYYYTVYNPFFISFCFILVAICALSVTHFLRYDLFAVSSGLIWASVLIQVVGIGMRIYILERPPVSTLYETVLFVCVLTMLYCVIQRKDFWLWIAAGLGIVLHILGFAHAQDGDTLVVLAAVLNTNFWLTTHVLTITAAYAFCALTSALAHYLLFKDSDIIYKNMMTCSLIALFLATIGTVLGGIWADQSWGRFWGWDPKENGALLIVLWLIWVLHGRISGMMGRTSVLYGLSYLSVVLALSWFGVNLLSVGLHSYGFTDSAGLYLGSFIVAETAFLAFIFYYRRQGLKPLSLL